MLRSSWRHIFAFVPLMSGAAAFRIDKSFFMDE